MRIEIWADFTMVNGDVCPFYISGVGDFEGDPSGLDDSAMDDVVKMLDISNDGPQILTSYDHFTYDEEGAAQGQKFRAIVRDDIIYATLRYNVVEEKS